MYENTAELALRLRIIPALSFVLEYIVSASFDLVIEEVQEVSEVLNIEKESVQKIVDLNYFFQKT